MFKIKTSVLYKTIRGYKLWTKGADVSIKACEILSGGVEIFDKGFGVFNEGFEIFSKGFEDFSKGIHVIDNEVEKTSKAKFAASLRTRSSTFAIRAKPTLKPKIAKELVLLQPHMAISRHL